MYNYKITIHMPNTLCKFSNIPADAIVTKDKRASADILLTAISGSNDDRDIRVQYACLLVYGVDRCLTFVCHTSQCRRTRGYGIEINCLTFYSAVAICLVVEFLSLNENSTSNG